MYPGFLFTDPTFLLLIPALILAMYAQSKVRNTFARYMRVPSRAGLTGAQLARRLLDSNGLTNVAVELARGFLGDHYDPRTRTLRLSEEVYSSSSLAALGVAAHETGHALQHAQGYGFLSFRNSLFPVAAFGSQAALPLFFIGLLMAQETLMTIGIWLFIGAVAFQLITLPVEFNASSRAIALLREHGYLAPDEVPKAKAVLGAAALTYVAAATVAVAQLVRLLVLRGMLGGRDE